MEYIKTFLDSMTGFEQNPKGPEPQYFVIDTPALPVKTEGDIAGAKCSTVSQNNAFLTFLEKEANAEIQKYQLVLKDIQVCDELQTFRNMGHFDVGFIKDLEWLRDTWLDDESEELFDAKKVGYIEDQLIALPFETAFIHKNELYRTASLEEIRQDVFKEPAEWRMDPSLVMTMSKEDKLRIFTHFEYMCYYVINTREELLYDIKATLEIQDE